MGKLSKKKTSYEWHELHLYKNAQQPDKLIGKIPMQQTVVDRWGAVFDYYITNGHVVYIFRGYSRFENNEKMGDGNNSNRPRRWGAKNMGRASNIGLVT